MKKYFKRKLKIFLIKHRLFFDFISQIGLYFKKPLTVRKGENGKILICYITKPFRSQNHRGHSNQQEVIRMADVLAEFGYAVDVVDYNSEFSIDYSSYYLLIGFGKVFARSFSVGNFRGKRILHLTGANPNFSNEAEARRARNLCTRRGVLMSPRREAYWPWMFSAVNSDAMFVLGNNWTLSTYNELNKNTYLIPVPYVAPVEQGVINKDFTTTKNSFCWFSGSGAVHKGLDLVIEAIEAMGSGFHLNICGPIENERDFILLYKNSIFGNRNITFHAFVDVESQSMKRILATNVFVILPSCSEGSASSVITCMAGGLIPIVTKETGVEVGDFGFEIDTPDVSSVIAAMQKAVSMDIEDLKIMSNKAVNYVRDNHSYDAYEKALNEAISVILH